MLVGAELQATADAEAAIDPAQAARGAALLDALHTLTAGHARPGHGRARARLGGLRPGPHPRLMRACSPRPGRSRRGARQGPGIVEQALLEGARRRVRGPGGQARRGAAGPRMRRRGRAPRGARRAAARERSRPARHLRGLRRACRATCSCRRSIPADAYTDDAVVTHDDNGVPTSSSSQPSLMARMLDRLDVAPGHPRARDRRRHGLQRRAASPRWAPRSPSVELPARGRRRGARAPRGRGRGRPDVVTGDGADPAARPVRPDHRHGRRLGARGAARGRARRRRDPRRPPAAQRDRGRVRAAARGRRPPRRRGAAVRVHAVARRGGGPGRGAGPLGAGGHAIADADLGHGGPRQPRPHARPRPAPAARGPAGGALPATPLDALLWIALQGDPLLSLALPRPGGGRPGLWTLALDVLPASLLVLELAGGYADIAGRPLHGGEAALRTLESGLAGWRVRGLPPPVRARPHRRTAPRPQRLEPAVPGRLGAARRCTAALTGGRCATRSAESAAGSSPVRRARERAHRSSEIQTAWPCRRARCRRRRARATAVPCLRPSADTSQDSTTCSSRRSAPALPRRRR